MELLNKSPLLTCAPNGLLWRLTITGTRWCIYAVKSSWWWAQ